MIEEDRIGSRVLTRFYPIRPRKGHEMLVVLIVIGSVFVLADLYVGFFHGYDSIGTFLGVKTRAWILKKREERSQNGTT